MSDDHKNQKCEVKIQRKSQNHMRTPINLII
jgi:hypothetical protein